jgi:hypothetical protein
MLFDNGRQVLFLHWRELVFTSRVSRQDYSYNASSSCPIGIPTRDEYTALHGVRLLRSPRTCYRKARVIVERLRGRIEKAKSKQWIRGCR